MPGRTVIRGADIVTMDARGDLVGDILIEDGAIAEIGPSLQAPDAEARLFVRALPGSDFVARVRALAPQEGVVEELSFTPPDHYPRLHGFDRAVVPFGSDAPRLRKLAPSGMVALCGPGSIRA